MKPGARRYINHVQWSPDGKRICFDSPHAGGRQMYLMEIDPSVTDRKR
jgi:Tol biopolymer transport system component